MTSTKLATTSRLELQSARHTVIFRSRSIEDIYPGGLEAFQNHYSCEANDHIAVHVVAVAGLGGMIRPFEAMGLVQGNDFVALETVECEMLCMIHAEQVEQPFWFEAGADWLKYKYWKGKILVWYDG